LTDEKGAMLYQVDVAKEGMLAKRAYPLSLTIESQTFNLGTLNIVLDKASLEERIDELWKFSLATSFCVAFVSSLLLVWLFHHWVGLQLQQVSLYASQLNAQNLASPLVLQNPYAPDDEIGSIVLALSNMQSKLLIEFERRSAVEVELKAYQSHLEAMVDDRTKQLARQTQVLESQSHILVEQNAELNAFAHTVAHDLKHPITSLIGISTLLSKAFDSLDKEQQQAFLEQILQSSQKMNAMINGLLQLASLRSDETPILVDVDMRATIDGALKTLSSLIAEYNPIIVVYPNFPVVKANAQWVEEIWLNYISNAIKYGGEPAFITIGFDEQDSSSRYTFWVEDRGVGLSPEQASDLFTEFNRLHTQRHDSHGLGLSIVRRICNKLGGKCGYEHIRDGGSRFWFSIPN
jgi:signal transduction histidine kinase